MLLALVRLPLPPHPAPEVIGWSPGRATPPSPGQAPAPSGGLPLPHVCYTEPGAGWRLGKQIHQSAQESSAERGERGFGSRRTVCPVGFPSEEQSTHLRIGLT